MGVALNIMLAVAIGLLLFGSLVPGVIFKIVVMALGYAVILFVRDTYKLYAQDVLFLTIPKEQHQTVLTILSFGVKIATSGLGLVFSAILLSYSMFVIIAIMLAIATAEIVMGIILYRAIFFEKTA